MLQCVSFYIKGVNSTSITIPYVKELITDLKKNKLSITYFSSDADLGSLSNASETLLITDSPVGIEAANAKEIPCVIYTPTDQKDSYYSSAYMLIEGFEEIDSAFLMRIYQRARNIPFLIAQTAHCLIRETTEDDIPLLSSLHQDPAVLKYIEPMEADKTTLEESLRLYPSLIYPFYEFGLWTVLDLTTGTVIGRCGLESKQIDGGAAIVLGYIIAPAWQKKGLACECVQKILTYGFDTLGFEKIIALIDDGNLPSIALALRCGLHSESSILYGKKLYSIYQITNPHKEEKRLENARLNALHKYKQSNAGMVYKKRYPSHDIVTLEVKKGENNGRIVSNN